MPWIFLIISIVVLLVSLFTIRRASELFPSQGDKGNPGKDGEKGEVGNRGPKGFPPNNIERGTLVINSNNPPSPNEAYDMGTGIHYSNGTEYVIITYVNRSLPDSSSLLDVLKNGDIRAQNVIQVYYTVKDGTVTYRIREAVLSGNNVIWSEWN